MAADDQGAVGGNTPEEEKQLFLSYGHGEHVDPFAQQLKRDLEGEGFTVWMDVDIQSGDGWVGGIGSGIQQCKGVIAIITNKYVNSEYGTSELTLAKDKKKKIFPIIFEQEVDYTKQPHAPGVELIIRPHQWTYFRPRVDNYSQSFDKLVLGLKAKGIQPAPVEETDDNTTATTAPRTFPPGSIAPEKLSPGSIAPEKLSIKNLPEVKAALGYFSRWNDLGLNLGLHPDLVDVISKIPGIPERVEEVLKNWLRNNVMDKQKKPTWSQLVAAVAPIDHALSEDIKKDHPN